MKKAMRWLEEAGVDFRFHDVRKDGLHPDRLAAWCAGAGWEALLNRRGTTWRRLDEGERQDVCEQLAMALMLAHPGLIKRPVLEFAGYAEVGFSPGRYAALFASAS